MNRKNWRPTQVCAFPIANALVFVVVITTLFSSLGYRRLSPTSRPATSGPWSDSQHDFYQAMSRSDMRYGGVNSAPPTTLNFPMQHPSSHSDEEPNYSLYPETPWSALPHHAQHPRDAGYHYLPHLHIPSQDYQPYPTVENGYGPARPIPFASAGNKPQQPLLMPYPAPYQMGERHHHHEGSISPGSISPSPSVTEPHASPPHSFPGHGHMYEYPSPASSLPASSSLPNLQNFHPYGPPPTQHGSATSDRSATQSPLLLSAVGPSEDSSTKLDINGLAVGSPTLEESADRLPQGTPCALPFLTFLLSLNLT